MANPPFIIVSNLHKAPIAKSSKRVVKLGLFFGHVGSAPISPGVEVVLAFYDVDSYLANQRRLAREAGASNRHETDETLFNEKTAIAFDLAEHEVSPGTGVLFLARVQVEPKPDQPWWYVTTIQEVHEQDRPPFDLFVEVQGKQQTIEYRTLGAVGPSEAEFDAMLQGGTTRRRYAVRVLSSDQKQVLLSSMNPDLGTAGIPFQVQYLPAAPDAPDPQQFTDRRQPIDLTGMYLEDPPSEQSRRAQSGSAASDVRAPAILSLNQAGQAIVGWYEPIADGFVDNHVIPQLFSAGVREEMLSPSAASVLGSWSTAGLIHNDLNVRKEEDVFHISLFQADDPITLLDTQVGIAERSDTRKLRLILPDPDDESVLRLEQDDGDAQNTWTFRKLNGNSRLPKALVAEFARSAGFARFRRELEAQHLQARQTPLDRPPPLPSTDEVLGSFLRAVEPPLPPAIDEALDAVLCTLELARLLGRWIDARNAGTGLGDTSRQRVVEVEISRYLASAFNGFDPVSRGPRVVRAREQARHRVFRHDGAEHGFFEKLDEIAGDVLQRQAGPDSEDRHWQVYTEEIAGKDDYYGFAVWGFGAVLRYTYELEFDTLSESVGTFAKGSAGVFELTITGFEDGIERPDFLQWEYVGAFLGGGVGAGVSIAPLKKRKGTTQSGGPISCTLRSHLRLRPDHFYYAIFSTFSLVKPSANVAAGPLELGNDWHETVLSVTLFNRNPTALLDGVIEGKFYEFKDPVAPNQIKDHLKAWAKAIQDGDLKEAPLPALNAHLAALTLSVGIVLPSPSEASAVGRTDFPEDSVEARPQSLQAHFNFRYRVVSSSFAPGSHLLQGGAIVLMDYLWALLRKLIGSTQLLTLHGCTSPEWGKLGREGAHQENVALARDRGDSVLAHLYASVGTAGDRVIEDSVDVKVRGYGASLFRLTQDPNEVAPGVVLDPFCAAVQEARNRAPQGSDPVLERVKTEYNTVYKYMRCVFVELNGEIAVMLSQDQLESFN